MFKMYSVLSGKTGCMAYQSTQCALRPPRNVGRQVPPVLQNKHLRNNHMLSGFSVDSLYSPFVRMQPWSTTTSNEKDRPVIFFLQSMFFNITSASPLSITSLLFRLLGLTASTLACVLSPLRDRLLKAAGRIFKETAVKVSGDIFYWYAPRGFFWPYNFNRLNNVSNIGWAYLEKIMIFFKMALSARKKFTQAMDM